MFWIGVAPLVLAGFFSLATIFVHNQQPIAPWLPRFALAFGGSGFIAVSDYFRVHFRLMPDGMAYQTTFRHGKLKWRDVVCVRYSNWFRWFVFEGMDGTIVRVPVMLTHLPELAEAVLDGINTGTLDNYVMAILDQTADGKLPAASI